MQNTLGDKFSTGLQFMCADFEVPLALKSGSNSNFMRQIFFPAGVHSSLSFATETLFN